MLLGCLNLVRAIVIFVLLKPFTSIRGFTSTLACLRCVFAVISNNLRISYVPWSSHLHGGVTKGG